MPHYVPFICIARIHPDSVTDRPQPDTHLYPMKRSPAHLLQLRHYLKDMPEDFHAWYIESDGRGRIIWPEEVME